MKHSHDRILTTHAGRLDGPPEYQEKVQGMFRTGVWDVDAIKPLIHSSIVDVIRRQTEAGIDIISDGELGRIGIGRVEYYGRRLTGLSTRKLKAGETAFMTLRTGERQEFADFYKGLNFLPPTDERALCSGPIKYIGQKEVERDMEEFRAAFRLPRFSRLSLLCVCWRRGGSSTSSTTSTTPPTSSTSSRWPTR